MIVVAYQTLEDRDNIDQIEAEGPYICRRHGSWLGLGYYLWDTKYEWSYEWGVNSYERNGKGFVIAECRLDLSKDCFDLVGSVQHQMDFLEIIQQMIISKRIKNEKEAIVPNLIQFMKTKGVFNFKSIRANDFHKDIVRLKFRNDKNEYMVLNQRVQICVITKKDVLLQPFRVIYPK